MFTKLIVRGIVVPLHRIAGWLLDRADSIENRL